MAKVLIFIDHDIMIRHFVRSRALEPLERRHAVVYVFPEKHRRVTNDPASLGLPAYRVVPISEERAYLWRRLYQATALCRARGSKDKTFLFEFWLRMLGRRGFAESWLYSWPATNALYRRRILRRLGPNHALEAFLAAEGPDLVLHPTVLEGLFVSDLVEWAATHEPPVVFLMNSWDNPSVKAMTVGHPDWLVVWGEQTKDDAVRHLACPAERVLTFGAAQFDLYRRPPRESREALLGRLGLAPNRLTLLYAGSSKGFNEVDHLRMLEQAVERGDLPPVQIIFRPHPWRGANAAEADFYSVSWKHVTMDPQMGEYYRASRHDASIIFTPEYEYTHSLLSAVDALVSPVSTILLEAVLHGKPVLAYMPGEEIEENFFAKTMANMKFMRDFYDRIDCGPCVSRRDFVAACRRLLETAAVPGIADLVRKQASYFVADEDLPYSELLVDLVDRLTSAPRPTPER